MAQYTGSSTEDVSAQVVWSATGGSLNNPPGFERSVFHAGKLTAELQSSNDPTVITFASYNTIANSLSGATSTLNYTDTNPPLGTQGGVFYRVALESQ